MHLQNVIQGLCHDALVGLVDHPAPYAALVRPTQDPKHGDYQANCAMSLAKALGKKPRDLAQEIVDRLPTGEVLEKPEIAGPGFINLRLQPKWMARQLQAMAGSDRLAVAPAAKPLTCVIDFSSPNVAKPMHVGHLRSTIIGDALTRLLRFLGHDVITDNHLGDWGTQFGIVLYGYKNFRDDAALKADPVQELARLYKHVRGLMKSDEVDDAKSDPIAQAARDETAKLHAGDPENVRLWKMFMPWCIEEIARIYRRLDVHFDHTHGESFYNPMLPGVVQDLLAKGIAQESEGAVIIRFGENEPPAMVRKRDGAFTYTTSDLATIRYRVESFKPDAFLYVVDARQALHFKHLFEAARRWGYATLHLAHISFGSVLGKEGKPIQTRQGEAVALSDLLDEAAERAGAVYDATLQEARDRGDDVVELTDAEKKHVCEAIGIGAVKYADLSQNRTTDYKFDFDKMLAMNGNTATYMQYAYVRNRGIFRKGDEDPARFRTDPIEPLLDTPAERALAVQLLRLEESLQLAAAEHQPSGITSYLWDLAKTYSTFFHDCPVLKAETPVLRESRLLLCDLTARVLARRLDLLGIKTVERM